MRLPVLSIIYLLFFFSGAAALIYEVVWVRSLSLVFGGTHLAVTTVLSVFMGGLALGSHAIGKHVDQLKRPLRFYGFLELGIALSAIAFILLMKIYPSVYILLVRGQESSTLYLTFIRVLFAFLAMIVPTSLMGGTLPVLTRFVFSHPKKLGSRLSLLYGFNTLGAVVGTSAAGFFLLRFYSVSVTFYTAITMNTLIGLTSILLQDKVSAALPSYSSEATSENLSPQRDPERQVAKEKEMNNTLPFRMVLWGIGVSGFCALGYEVLWTRNITLAIGTSVYSFSIMLAAFLTGIALGSKAYGIFGKIFLSEDNDTTKLVIGFGIVQLVIGATALAVTFYLRDLQANSILLSDYFRSRGLGVFEARQWGNLTLAFSYMVVPAFFMGLAFPIAGKVNAANKERIGHAVGGVLVYNTIGAILGATVSGFFMIYIFGIERSLQFLVVINIGLGLLVLFSIKNIKTLNVAVIGVTLATMAFLILSPDVLRMWDAKYLAIYQNNQPEAYNTPQKIRDALENTDVLFYHEGIDSTISVIKIKGGNQALSVNGKVVASASLKDRQCQFTLGHLPMLLHKNPQKVLVVGLGTGMTLGAVSVHPSITELTLAELEPNVVGAARTFNQFNNHVLDNSKLNIVFNDGRNFLMITKNKFDVITADPIHPWTQGSGYLYTAEYFKLASERLAPGGIMCQWLPIYELSVDDLKSVVTTFSQHFKYTMTWLTHYDAEIIGSNSPIIIDEEALERRIAFPSIANDLKQVMMGSATDFLSYFLMATDGMKAFSIGGIVNTDDNLYLEFSTPISVGKNVMGINVDTLAKYRESILPNLLPARNAEARQEQERKWAIINDAAKIADHAHALFLGGHHNKPEFRFRLAGLEKKYPLFSPGRFLKQEYLDRVLLVPTLLEKRPLILLNNRGEKVVIEISAVIARVSEVRAAVVFVDNSAKKIFGKKYFSGANLDKTMGIFTEDVMAGIQAAYLADVEIAQQGGKEFPTLDSTMNRIKDIIQAKCGA